MEIEGEDAGEMSVLLSENEPVTNDIVHRTLDNIRKNDIIDSEVEEHHVSPIVEINVEEISEKASLIEATTATTFSENTPISSKTEEDPSIYNVQKKNSTPNGINIQVQPNSIRINNNNNNNNIDNNITVDNEGEVGEPKIGGIKAQDVTEEMVQKFIEECDILHTTLFEEQIADVDINYFFSREYSSKYLLEKFPQLWKIYSEVVPHHMNSYTFWIVFMLFVHHEWDKENTEVVKFDYHSLNRYVVSCILSFLKVVIVVAILRHYSAPWYFYTYPAVWCLFGFLIVLRIIQLQRKNRLMASKIKEVNEMIELKEMESV